MYQNIPVINGYPKGKTTRSFTLFSLQCLFYFSFSVNICTVFQGRIQDFKLGGAHLKKLRQVEGGAKIFGVFRVKNHDFAPKNHIFFQF
jgi:hypothetical protein